MLTKDRIFSPLDTDLHLERIAGGNETEVYRTDDHRYVVKVKADDAILTADALDHAVQLRKAADRFAKAIGKKHSLPSYFILSQNEHGEPRPVAIQPYLQQAIALHDLDYKSLSRRERKRLARQLLYIMGRSVAAYLRYGWMPDLYGRTSKSKEERREANAWHSLPRRMWSFLVRRNLLRSHNLMLSSSAGKRIVLVDYDPVTRGKVYQRIYYAVRMVLFVRDFLLILWMLQGGHVPEA